MEPDIIVATLEGEDTTKATEVTYALDGAQPQAVLIALRRNLDREDADLVEITAMRLGVRFKDAASFRKFADVARIHPDDLVVSAALKALSSIPEQHPHLRADAEATLLSVAQSSCNPINQREAAREYLRLVGEITTSEYASADDATILARYETVVGTRRS